MKPSLHLKYKGLENILNLGTYTQTLFQCHINFALLNKTFKKCDMTKKTSF